MDSMILTKTGFDQMQISFIKNRMGSDRKKKTLSDHLCYRFGQLGAVLYL